MAGIRAFAKSGVFKVFEVASIVHGMVERLHPEVKAIAPTAPAIICVVRQCYCLTFVTQHDILNICLLGNRRY